MSPRISIEEEQAILHGMKLDAENNNRLLLTARKETADRVSQIYRQYPMLQPGTMLALAKNNAPDTVVKQVAEQTANAANANPDALNGKPKGNWITGLAKTVGGAITPDFAAPILKTAAHAVDVVGSPVMHAAGYLSHESGLTTAAKAVARPSFAAMDAALELTQNVAATAKNEVSGLFNLSKDISNIQNTDKISFDNVNAGKTDGSFFGSTTIKTLIDNWDKQGSGWFVGDEIKKEQAIRAGQYRGLTDGGHAWTIGRGAAGMIMKEGSYGYNLLSGALDGFVALKVPAMGGLGKVGEGFSELAHAEDANNIVKALGHTADVLQGRGVVIPISKMTGEQLREAHRLAGIVGDVIDPEQANKFLGSRGGRRLVERLVEANTADDVRALVGKNVYADTVKSLRDAKTELDVQAVLADVLGIPQKGLTRTVGVDGVHKFVLSNARRTKLIEGLESVPGGKKVVRGFSKQARNIGDISSEAPTDIRDTINAIDNWSRAALIPENEWELTKVAKDGTKTVSKMPGRRQILDQALDAMTGDTATPTARLAFKDKWEQTIQDTMIHQNGVDENVVNSVFKNFYQQSKRRSAWSLGVDGTPDGEDFYNFAVLDGEKISDGAFAGPMLQSELANVMIDMPDPKQVKALTNKFYWITHQTARAAKKDIAQGGDFYDNIRALAEAGKLRMPVAAAVWTQDKLWRRFILATGGFGLRNLQEAQIRMALSHRDVSGAFRHPFDYIAWAMHKKGGYDVAGNEFTYKTFSANMKTFRQSLEADLYRQYGDPSIVMRRGKRLGIFRHIDRQGDVALEDVVLAHGDQLGLLNADPIARLHAAGAQEKEILDFIKKDPEGQKWFRDQQDYHIKGRPIFDKTAKKYIGVQSVDLNNEENLRLLVQEIGKRVEAHTGGDTRLRNIIAGGQLPKETIADAKNIGLSQKDVGQVVSIPVAGKSKKLRQARVVSFNDATGEAVIVPFAFERGENTADLRKLLGDQTVLNNDKLAQILPFEERANPVWHQKWDASFDDGTDKLFGFLYGKPSRYLDRSPLFRQFYYETAIDQLLTGLSSEDAKLLHANIIESARKTGTTPAKFLGDTKRWGRIEDAASGKLKLTGAITLDELDAYAKGNALDEVKHMLYDASNTSNYLAATRIVSPFSAAYVDFFKSVGKMYTIPTASGMRLPNITAFRKTQLMVEGGREADPDNNGRGFFFTDPNTGEWSFNYPAGGAVVKALTGVKGDMVAPVSGALQGVDFGKSSPFGLKFSPGVGPYFSIAATWLLGSNPAYEDFRKVLLPFGPVKPGLGAVLPSWVQKIAAGWTGDYKSNKTLGDSVMQVAQVLATSGKYDLTDANEVVRMQNDAKSKGQILAVLSAVAQWTGPSRPKVDFIEKYKGMDVFVSQVVSDLHRWQQENYDTATQKLFDVYGEKFWPYLAKKTTSQYAGLEATKEFDKWAYGNKTFLEAYPRVAAYFAPVGTDWDWQVYARQMADGMRIKLPLRQSLEEAQWSAGYSQYKLASDAAGPKPTPNEEKVLAELKTNLYKLYPGYKASSYDVNKTARQIEDLKAAAYYKGLDNNPVALGAREYLANREAILNTIPENKPGLTAKVNRNKLNALKNSVVGIVEKYPEFQRLFDRVLSKELEY